MIGHVAQGRARKAQFWDFVKREALSLGVAKASDDASGCGGHYHYHYMGSLSGKEADKERQVQTYYIHPHTHTDAVHRLLQLLNPAMPEEIYSVDSSVT